MRCVCQPNLKHMNVIYAHHPKLHWNRNKREETHEIYGKKDQQQETLDFMNLCANDTSFLLSSTTIFRALSFVFRMSLVDLQN